MNLIYHALILVCCGIPTICLIVTGILVCDSWNAAKFHYMSNGLYMVLFIKHWIVMHTQHSRDVAGRKYIIADKL